MGNTFFFEWEMQLIEFIQQFMTPLMTKFASVIAFFGDEIGSVLCLGFIYWVYDKNKSLKYFITLLTVDLAFPIAKNIARRRRPYMDNDKIKCLLPVDKEADIMNIAAQGYSFPSGHTANASTNFAWLGKIFGTKLFKVLAIVMPLLIGITRFALGVHYPTDVIAGWILGYGGFFLVPWLASKFKNEMVFYWIIFGLSLSGCFFCTSNDYYSSLGLMFGFLLAVKFERKYVNFESTRNVLYAILRVLGGMAIFAVLNTVLKMPFSEELLASATATQFFIRFVRYAIIMFVDMAIYPMCFGKIFKKKANA